MTWRDDIADLRKLAAQRRTDHGNDDELAKQFLRIAERVEQTHGGTIRESGSDG